MPKLGLVSRIPGTDLHNIRGGSTTDKQYRRIQNRPTVLENLLQSLKQRGGSTISATVPATFRVEHPSTSVQLQPVDLLIAPNPPISLPPHGSTINITFIQLRSREKCPVWRNQGNSVVGKPRVTLTSPNITLFERTFFQKGSCS